MLTAVILKQEDCDRHLQATSIPGEIQFNTFDSRFNWSKGNLMDNNKFSELFQDEQQQRQIETSTSVSISTAYLAPSSYGTITCHRVSFRENINDHKIDQRLLPRDDHSLFVCVEQKVQLPIYHSKQTLDIKKHQKTQTYTAQKLYKKRSSSQLHKQLKEEHYRKGSKTNTFSYNITLFNSSSTRARRYQHELMKRRYELQKKILANTIAVKECKVSFNDPEVIERCKTCKNSYNQTCTHHYNDTPISNSPQLLKETVNLPATEAHENKKHVTLVWLDQNIDDSAD
ncbi:unnamed protein product [Didymodactylos carnosus]|uniref:Uncharacterized protein n=1 Tax=Didymodactylos carnosus TaxID=1234261 RepID=A0A8S2EFZ6_9BILA|nr:unnamed protein product [Didymodactylos carnosus]CAF4026186.1 unnamed protein product [Didymodactylos carnosus]